MGLHCYAGCDTISSFSGQGIKLDALTLVINNHKFRDALANLGRNQCHQVSMTYSKSSHAVYIVQNQKRVISKLSWIRRASCGDSYIPGCRHMSQEFGYLS